MNKRLTDVVSLSKLAEGGFNRAFVITLRGGRQMVARVPYPVTVPDYYAVASEVATIEYLRSCGIPAPEVYGYSADSNNAAGSSYILMDFVQGSKLSDVWPSLSDQDVISIIHQLTQLESQMMSLSFPAGGSLYFTRDLEKVSPGLGIQLEDKRFCVGPDTKLALWYGRRTQLDVNRGPCISISVSSLIRPRTKLAIIDHSAEEALAAVAHKEIAYLKRFGQPLLPLRRERRPSYKFEPQSPSGHIENLERYLSITSSLVPRDPALSRFCIRHPDLQPNNVFVSWSPDSGCKVVSLFDFQHTSILPMFLLAGIPQRFQNHADSVSRSMTPPSRPEDIDEFSEAKRAGEEYRYRCRLVHYHYVTSTEKFNHLHFTAFMDPLYALRGRLFLHAGGPWEGETSELKVGLIQATKEWEKLTGGGVLCPLKFDAKDLHETTVLVEELGKASRGFELLQSMRGVGEEGWVPSEDYESAVAFFKGWKEKGLAEAESAKEREEIMEHWPWDDMYEELYM